MLGAQYSVVPQLEVGEVTDPGTARLGHVIARHTYTQTAPRLIAPRLLDVPGSWEFEYN